MAAVRSGLGALVVVAVVTVGGWALPDYASAACGQDYRQAPAHTRIAGGPPLAIGDSVLADAVPELARDGFEADGMVCRQMSQGIAMLEERGATLPHLVVLALGTNGEVTPEQIDRALEILGPRRVLGLVTPHGSVVASTPEVIRLAADSHPGRILLLDWDAVAAGHPQWFAPDGVHLSGPAGIDAFAELIASALPFAAPVADERQSSTATPEVPPGPTVIHVRHPAAPPPSQQTERQETAVTSITAVSTALVTPTRVAESRSGGAPVGVIPAAGAAAAALLAAGLIAWRRRQT